jgi:hypothetical protein
MIVTIHQPEHLPWLGFCHKAANADVLVLLDTVQFRKNYFQNRNRILGPDGPMWLTVPVRQKGHTERTIAETEIDGGAWKAKWWKSLYYNYRRTPYFEKHAEFLESLVANAGPLLSDFNDAIINHVFAEFGITCSVVRASQLKAQGASSQLLAEICMELGGQVYTSGPYGRDYLDESLFRNAGIEVRYHDFVHPTYPQKAGAEFVSHLSSVDLLFRHGPASAQYLNIETSAT